MPDEDDDLLKPTTFKEKIHERTPDLLFLAFIMIVALAVIDAKRKGIVPNNNNNTEQALKQALETKQSNTVLFNDSINQKNR